MLARLLGGAAALVLLAGCGSSSAPPAATTSPGTTSDGGTMTTSPDGPAAPDGSDTSEGPDPDQPLGAGSVLTPQDDGAVVHLSPGEEVSLQLAPPWDGALPTSDDPDVVEVVPVDHFTDPGYAEFSLLAHAPGDTTVRVAGLGEEIVVHVSVTG